MSNKTQLQTNNASLNGYIARINAAKDVAAALPEAGGGGNGNIETCTIKFESGFEIELDSLAYTAINNGNLQFVHHRNIDLSSQSIFNNVVCGSIIFYSLNSFIYSFSEDENILLLAESWDDLNMVCHTCRAPENANDIGIISVIVGGGGGGE